MPEVAEISLTRDEVHDFLLYTAIRDGTMSMADAAKEMSEWDDKELFEFYEYAVDLPETGIRLTNADAEENTHGIEDFQFIFVSVVCPLCGKEFILIEPCEAHILAEHEDFMISFPQYELSDLVTFVRPLNEGQAQLDLSFTRQNRIATRRALPKGTSGAPVVPLVPICPVSRQKHIVSAGCSHIR